MEKLLYWQPFKKGIFLLIAEDNDYFGIELNCMYDYDSKDLKTTVQLGTYIFVIGWHFQ